MPTNSTTDTAKLSKKTNAALWTVQALLAALFLFAGGMKLVMPAAVLAQQSGLPAAFMKFIGLCEIAGALGLILPGLVGIRPGLTPLAAVGLVIIMLGAVTLTLASRQFAGAAVPGFVAVLAVLVARGRWQAAGTRTSKLPVVASQRTA